MNEKVLVVKKEKLKNILFKKFRMEIDNWFYFYKVNFNDIIGAFVLSNPEFLIRKNIEQNFDYLQIIPYLLFIIKVNNKKMIFIYERNGSEKRLHGLYSAGIGGHININYINNDMNSGGLLNNSQNLKNIYSLKNLIIDSLLREVKEETGFLINKNDKNLKFYGIIGENKTDPGKVHIGLVFKFEIVLNEYSKNKNNTIQKNINIIYNKNNIVKNNNDYDDEDYNHNNEIKEFVKKHFTFDKREIKNYYWISLSKSNSIKEDIKLEYWSRLSLNLLKKSKTLYCLFSHKLVEKQIEDAVFSHVVNRFVYLPDRLQKLWSNVPPYNKSIKFVANKFVKYIQDNVRKKDLILIQGDFGLSFMIVSYCMKNGYNPVYATTKRVSIEKKSKNDNKVSKTLIFEHVCFRSYKDIE